MTEIAILEHMKLIGSPTSPYVRKVRIVFFEKKVDVDLEIENVWAPDTKITNYNPLGKVPCLLLDDGEAIYDSRVIAEYVDTLSPVGKLIPTESRERATVKTWEALADGIKDAGILARPSISKCEAAPKPHPPLRLPGHCPTLSEWELKRRSGTGSSACP